MVSVEEITENTESSPRTPRKSCRARERSLARTAILTVTLLLLGGCCTGPTYMALAYDPRVELGSRQTFALVAPVLSDSTVWAYGEPAEHVRARVSDYRAAPAAGRDVLGAPDAAPAQLAAALAEAKRSLIELGYAPVREGQPEGFVVALALTTLDDGSLSLLTLQIGAELDGRFDPRAIALAVRRSTEDPCPASAAELTAELVRFLPPQGSEAP